MYKVIRALLLFTTVVSIVACGEGFRGQTAMDSDTAEETEFFNADGSRRSFTESDVDREILNEYASELNGFESATQNLSGTIRAFDLVLAADENQNFTMQARIAISCNESYQFSRSINRQQMLSMSPVDLGVEGPYSIEVQCTSRSCQELVAAIRKNSGSNQGTVLVGLAVGGQGEGEILFVSRSVKYQPYFANFQNVQSFEQANSCSIGGGGNQSIGDILTDKAVEVGTDLLKSWWDQNKDDLLDKLF